jgi:hypothetical protein
MRFANASYLQGMLQSLQCALNSDAATPHMLLYNAEVPPAQHHDLETITHNSTLWRSFSNVRVEQRQSHYADLVAVKESGGLPRTHDDPPEQVWWRSKEALDVANMMELALQAAPRASYYIHMQDDVVVAQHFLRHLNNLTTQLATRNGPVTLFSPFDSNRTASYVAPDSGGVGLVAVCFDTHLVRRLIPYIRQRFLESPVDFLIRDYMETHNVHMHVAIPNLVEHEGLFSS